MKTFYITLIFYKYIANDKLKIIFFLTFYDNFLVKKIFNCILKRFLSIF